MEERKPPGRVENYTHAFLVTAGVILFMGFWTIAALFGWLWVAITAWGIDRTVVILGRRGT